MSNLPNLPFDIITNILSRLPAKSLLRFKCVSKPWYQLIKQRSFIKMHLTHTFETNNNRNIMLRHCYLSSMDYDLSFNQAKDIDYPFKTSNSGVEIYGSCDGLLVITPDEDVYCIWNPITQEFKKLPITSIVFPQNCFCCRTICYGFGFGYDHVIDDYKVVRIVNFYGADDDEFDSEVKIYTLRTNSWKKVEGVPFHILYKRVSGVLVNGNLHWAATRKPESDLTKVIVSFDLVAEVFKEVSQPNYENSEFHMNLGVLGGSLCVLSNFYKSMFDVWVMKDYGVKDSWTKLLSISQHTTIGSFDYLKPLCYFKDSSILLEKNNKEIVLYDLESGNAKTLDIRGIPDWFEAESYIGSLVSLNSGTLVWQQQQQAKERNQKKKKSRKTRGLLALRVSENEV